ncbi:MAG: NAD-dependent epimerase/dehydratase family protein, partial [Elusimicrobia bacterium]|nr:NAD-dependent epimerase/dehydratase family protein [Elusimicrobiota bacterium]
KTRNVVSALVDKFKQAKSNNENFVRVWGDGSSVRDFLYIGDAVSAILLAIEKYDNAEPLNIGTGIAASIKNLVDTVIQADSFSGEIIWEKDKPNGIAYRVLKIDKMKKVLNYTPATSLEEGIRTVSSG